MLTYQDLFTALDRYFVESKHRKAVLRFMGDYLQSQPPHLYQILQTTFFADIIKCLQYDTSTTIVSSALTSLIMLMPHMPSSLAPHLPTLFNIYARLLFWSRERAEGSVSPLDRSDASGSWEVCSYEPIEDLIVAHLQEYYTLLYGLYPLNFMDYIRKPQRYLRHANVANADDMEVQPTEIRDKSERFRRCHLLHRNFYTLTIESEKTDFGRWLKSEAAEVAASCMSLCLAGPEASIDFVQPPSIAERSPFSDDIDEGYDTPILSRSVEHESEIGGPLNMSASSDSLVSSPLETAATRQGSQSINPPSTRDTLEVRKSEAAADSPTLPPHLTQSSSYTQLQDMLQSNKAIKSALHQSLANDSVPSLSLSNQGSVAERPSTSAIPPLPTISAPLSLTETHSKLAQLQQRILMLQNDLNFETYQKQQHMARIGDLRRKRMEEAVTEAEMQNLMITNRNLKNRFEEAKKAEMQVRRDSEKSRALAKKWEADLSNKMKNLRDESKKLNAEVDKLKKELDASKVERQKLLKLVCEAEVKELKWNQRAQFAEMQEPEVQRLKGEVEDLMIQLRDYQAKEVDVEDAANVASAAKEELEKLKLKMQARDNEYRTSQELSQAENSELLQKLTEAGKGKGPAHADQMSRVKEHLEASRAKQEELQKQVDLLSRKYTSLQSSFLDFRAGEAPPPESLPFSENLKDLQDNPTLVTSSDSSESFKGPFQRAPLRKTPSAEAKVVMPGPTPSRKTPAPPPMDVLEYQKQQSEAARIKPQSDGSRKSEEKKNLKGIRGYV